MRKPNNQWHESALLRAFKAHGMIKSKDGGSAIEIQNDYRKNTDTDFLATPTTATGTGATDVINAGSYDWADLVVPINTTISQEAKTSGDENKKIDLAKSLVRNAIDSHDAELEAGMATTTTDGFLGCQTLIPDNGQPNVAGLDGSSLTYWRNYSDTYASDGSDIEAALTIAFNTTTKGTGGIAPALLWTGSEAIAIYEGQLQTQQRFLKGDKASGGYEALAFKNCDFVYSQHFGTRIYGASPKAFELVVAKGYFRRLEKAERFLNAAMRNQLVYSLLQLCTLIPSRTFVLTQV